MGRGLRAGRGVAPRMKVSQAGRGTGRAASSHSEWLGASRNQIMDGVGGNWLEQALEARPGSSRQAPLYAVGGSILSSPLHPLRRVFLSTKCVSSIR